MTFPSNKNGKCTKCEKVLTVENSYKYGGYTHKQCKECRNSYGRELSRKKAKEKKETKWF